MHEFANHLGSVFKLLKKHKSRSYNFWITTDSYAGTVWKQRNGLQLRGQVRLAHVSLRLWPVTLMGALDFSALHPVPPFSHPRPLPCVSEKRHKVLMALPF